jgi:hypothetical protein
MTVEAIDRSGCLWDDFPARWYDAVGALVAQVARPVAFTLADGSLTVLVETESWLRELTPLRGDMLAKLPATIDGAALHRIALRLRREAA